MVTEFIGPLNFKSFSKVNKLINVIQFVVELEFFFWMFTELIKLFSHTSLNNTTLENLIDSLMCQTRMLMTHYCC